MTISSAFLSELTTGRNSAAVEVRLLRFWEARNVRRGGELMGIDMLLLDSKATMMPATINVHRLSTHRRKLKEGSTYSLSGFDVTNCSLNFRLSDSSLMIRFNDITAFNEIPSPESPIRTECFRFRNNDELLGLANTNNQLPDIMGAVTAVKSTVTDPPQDKNRVMVSLKLDSDHVVTLSMFDAQAARFHSDLDAFNGDPRVLVATSINPKIVGGRLFLNATSGTHTYFDKATLAGEALFYKLVAQTSGLTPAAPLIRGYSKVEPLRISELNDFVITAPSQDIDFICTGAVTGLKLDNGWCYVACSTCNKKLQRSVSGFSCLHCNNSNAVGVLRYRVEMNVADDSGEATFVCFDAVMTKLHNVRANEIGNLLVGEAINAEEAEAPPCVKAMEGRTYTFQVRVSTYNFTANHKTFTVSRIISERDQFPLPGFVDNGGDDGNGDDDAGDSKVNVKGEIGGLSQPPMDSTMKKKARKE